MINKFSFLNDAKHFSLKMFQNCLVYMPGKKYVKYFNSTDQIYLQKSNGMSEESIENITTLKNLFSPTFVNHYIFLDVNFNAHRLIHNNINIPKK